MNNAIFDKYVTIAKTYMGTEGYGLAIDTDRASPILYAPSAMTLIKQKDGLIEYLINGTYFVFLDQNFWQQKTEISAGDPIAVGKSKPVDNTGLINYYPYKDPDITGGDIHNFYGALYNTFKNCQFWIKAYTDSEMTNQTEDYTALFGEISNFSRYEISGNATNGKAIVYQISVGNGAYILVDIVEKDTEFSPKYVCNSQGYDQLNNIKSGWFTDSTLSTPYSGTITEDTILYAKFTYFQSHTTRDIVFPSPEYSAAEQGAKTYVIKAGGAYYDIIPVNFSTSTAPFYTTLYFIAYSIHPEFTDIFETSNPIIKCCGYQTDTPDSKVANLIFVYTGEQFDETEALPPLYFLEWSGKITIQNQKYDAETDSTSFGYQIVERARWQYYGSSDMRYSLVPGLPLWSKNEKGTLMKSFPGHFRWYVIPFIMYEMTYDSVDSPSIIPIIKAMRTRGINSGLLLNVKI